MKPVHQLSVPVLLLSFAGCVTVSPGKVEQTIDGLTRIQSTRGVDVVFTAPGMTLAPYRQVMLDPVDVAFKRDWQQRHPEVTAEQLARIRSEAAQLFREVFSRELQDEGGYTLTDRPGPDVLRVSASIVDLDIASPGGAASDAGPTYVLSPEDLTLLADLRDSVSGARLVRAADRQRGRQSGNLRIVNAMSGSAEAQRTFAIWADLLRDALDTAKATSADSSTARGGG